MSGPGKVVLVDYGAGNLHSVYNALKRVGGEVEVTADPDRVRHADRIVLPGVGSFKACREGLQAICGLEEALVRRVRDEAVPFLGICVGMQLLAERGFEHGESAGLGWIAGEVRAIAPQDISIKVPHMGWNTVMTNKGANDGHNEGPSKGAHPLIEAGEAYFLHSYHFLAQNRAEIAATTHHGEELVAAVARDNMLGVQFHPEKSQTYGLALLSRFMEWKL